MPVFSNIVEVLDFPIVAIPQHTSFENVPDFSWIVLSILVSPEIINIGFGNHGHVQISPNHEHEGFSGSPKMKSKSY